MTPVERWVDEVARTTTPDRVVWCDGSEEENRRLMDGMLADGTLMRPEPAGAPRARTLHRSHPSDVARTEHLTFISSRNAGGRRPDQQLDGAREARGRRSARSSRAR